MLMLIAGVIGFFFVSSSFNTSGIGIAPGKLAPSLTVENEEGEVSLSKMKGKFVVLNFWSVADPEGRLSVKRVQNHLSRHKRKNKFAHIGINTEGSEELFNTIVRNDGLNPNLQYHVDGKTAKKIEKNFQLSSGVNTVVINPEGTIIAVNPDEKTMTKIISEV